MRSQGAGLRQDCQGQAQHLLFQHPCGCGKRGLGGGSLEVTRAGGWAAQCQARPGVYSEEFLCREPGPGGVGGAPGMQRHRKWTFLGYLCCREDTAGRRAGISQWWAWAVSHLLCGFVSCLALVSWLVKWASNPRASWDEVGEGREMRPSLEEAGLGFGATGSLLPELHPVRGLQVRHLSLGQPRHCLGGSWGSLPLLRLPCCNPVSLGGVKWLGG